MFNLGYLLADQRDAGSGPGHRWCRRAADAGHTGDIDVVRRLMLLEDRYRNARGMTD
jgi:hypothetical protein